MPSLLHCITKLDIELIKRHVHACMHLEMLETVIEKVVAAQFVNHLIHTHLMDTLQSAYKERHSTQALPLRV